MHHSVYPKEIIHLNKLDQGQVASFAWIEYKSFLWASLQTHRMVSFMLWAIFPTIMCMSGNSSKGGGEWRFTTNTLIEQSLKLLMNLNVFLADYSSIIVFLSLGLQNSTFSPPPPPHTPNLFFKAYSRTNRLSLISGIIGMG